MINKDPYNLIKSSTKTHHSQSIHVKINHSKLTNFINTSINHDLIKSIRNINLGENGPIKYSFKNDFTTEINFWCVYGIMQFGHGFRSDLHKYYSRGASKTISLGIYNMLCDGLKLNGEELKGIKEKDVEKYFEIDCKNKPLDIFVGQIRNVLNEIGRNLIEKKFESFYEFVEFYFKKDGKSSSLLMKRFINTFPSLQDCSKVSNGSIIYLYKKAQLIISFLSEKYEFNDINNIVSIVDNVVPSVLVQLGLIDLSKEISDQIKNKICLDNTIEAEYRCVSSYVISLISEKMKLRGDYLSSYFWMKGKEEKYRKTERHYNKNTVFY